jgi:DNA-binding transcriptional LysR family regulator
MDLRSPLYFIAVAKEMSLTRAAFPVALIKPHA